MAQKITLEILADMYVLTIYLHGYIHKYLCSEITNERWFQISTYVWIIETVLDFFEQVGHETMLQVEISNFFGKSCHLQTYHNYEQPPQYQNSDFQSYFSVSKIGQKKKFSMKNIWLGDQLLLQNVFEIFDF